MEGKTYMNEIIIKANMTEDDYIRFNLYTLNKSYKLNLQYKILIVFGTACIAYSFFSNSSFWYLILLIGVLSIIIRYSYPASIVRKIKKIIKDSPNILSSGEITCNSYEIIENTKISTTTVQWKDIYSVDEDGDRLYIFITKIQAFIIDINLLTDQEMSQIKHWISESKQVLN